MARRKKFRLKKSTKRKIRRVLLRLVIFLGFLVLLASIFLGMKYFFLESKVFALREIKSNSDKGHDFIEPLIGRNLFKLSYQLPYKQSLLPYWKQGFLRLQHQA